MRIFRNMLGGNLVYNLEDPELRKRLESIPGQLDLSTFSLTEESRSYAEDGRIVVVFNEREIEFQVEQLPIKGEHNQLNIMAAVNVALIYGVTNDSIHRSLPTFKNHPNRLEFIGQPADEATRRKYVGKAYLWGRNGNPVRYVNA